MFSVKEEDIKGDIQGFPIEIINRMLYHQFIQTEKYDISVFQKSRSYSKAGKGFTWCETVEGDYFWTQVIDKKQFGVFFQKYPKKEVILGTITEEEFKSKSKIKQNAIEVRNPSPAISGGKRQSGNTISGRRSKTAVTSGCVSYKEIYCS